MVVMSSQRLNSNHSTEISAPINDVWSHLRDFETWHSWNPSVRLPANFAPGKWGNAMMVEQQSRRRRKRGDAGQKTKSGKKRWISTTCCIDDDGKKEKYTIVWTTKRGFFRNITCMKLTCVGSRRTLLTHTQTVYGPFLTLRGAPSDLLCNSSCINQCLKNHVECLRFRSLLMDVSTRGMTKSSTSMTSCCDEEEDTVCSDNFWTSPVKVRNAVVSELMEEEAEYCVELR